MVTSFLAATLALSAKIDFETTGATVPRIVERLAEKTGLPLIADLNLESDVLVVSFKQVETDQALEWIAQAIDAEWKDDRGRRRLMRTPAVELAQEREERKAVFSEMRRALDSIKLAPPIDKETAERIAPLIKPTLGNENIYPQLPYELSSRMPMQRLVSRIAKELDYLKFEGLPAGVRIYVPFDEKNLDPRLPRSITKYVLDFKKEDAIYAQAIKQFGLDLSQLNGYMFSPGDWNDGALQGAVAITGDGGMFDVSLILEWGSSSGILRQEALRWPEQSSADKWRAIERPEWQVEWSVPALTREFASLRTPRSVLTVASKTTVPQSLLDFFTVSEDFDIFGLGSGRLLIDAANLSGKNLVACLPDTSAHQVRAVQRYPKPTVQQVLDRVAMTFFAKATVSDDLLMFKPVRPAESRRDRLSRALIRDIVIDGLAGKSDLLTYASLVASTEYAGWIGDPREEYSSVTRIEHYKAHHQRSAFALMLYGKLSGAQRDAASRGVLLVPWMSLPKADRTLWSYIMLSEGQVGLPGALSVEEWPGSKGYVDRTNTIRAGALSQQGPDGIAIRVTKSVALIGGSTTEEHVPVQLIEDSGLASMFAHKELGMPGWELDRFMFLPHTEITVYVRVGGKDALIAKYGESFAKEGGEMFGYESIPKELLESRRPQIDAIKKLLKDRGG